MIIDIQGVARYNFHLSFVEADILKRACELHYDGFVRTHGKQICVTSIRASTNMERKDVSFSMNDRELQCLAKACELSYYHPVLSERDTLRHLHEAFIKAIRFYNGDLFYKWKGGIASKQGETR